MFVSQISIYRLEGNLIAHIYVSFRFIRCSSQKWGKMVYIIERTESSSPSR